MSELETIEKKEASGVSVPSKRQLVWQWKWLVAPLLGVSALLHIALLFIPLPTWNSAAEETLEEEIPQEEAEGPVDILSLSEIAAPEPPAEPPPEQPQQPQAPPPSGAVPPPPDPTQVPETPVAEEEEFYDEDLPVDDGLSDASASFDASVATDQFVGDLSGLGVRDYTSDVGLPPAENLRNPGNAACFLDPSGGTVPGVRVANWLDKEPQTLLRENLKDVYEPRGITFTELPPFCGERYFQAVSADGSPFMTFSLVQLTGSTLLVVWDTPPQ